MIECLSGENDLEIRFDDDDYYQSELSSFIFAVATNNRDLILSPFYDALRTYELTWAIKDMFDKNCQ